MILPEFLDLNILKIANKMPSEVFFQKFVFENVDEDLRIIISHGLEDIYN